MKKLISIILSFTMLLPLATAVLAEEPETVGGKITLTQFLGASAEDTKEIILALGDATMTTKTEGFYAIADQMILTSQLDVTSTDLGGLYITVLKNDGTYAYAYITAAGDADKYSMAMSRLPYAMYTADDGAMVAKLFGLVPAGVPAMSAWAREAIETAEQAGIVVPSDSHTMTDYTIPVTREDFCGIAFSFLSGNGYEILDSTAISPFADTVSPAVRALYAAGIIKGKTETRFAPIETITREEAAVILYRMTAFMKKPIPTKITAEYYEDIFSVSDWARDAVCAMKEMGVMNGISAALFSPKEVYTIEQAVVTMIRLYEYN